MFGRQLCWCTALVLSQCVGLAQADVASVTISDGEAAVQGRDQDPLAIVKTTVKTEPSRQYSPPANSGGTSWGALPNALSPPRSTATKNNSAVQSRTVGGASSTGLFGQPPIPKRVAQPTTDAGSYLTGRAFGTPMVTRSQGPSEQRDSTTSRTSASRTPSSRTSASGTPSSRTSASRTSSSQTSLATRPRTHATTQSPPQSPPQSRIAFKPQVRQVVSQQPLPTPPSNYQVRQAECETCVDNGSQSYCADGSCAEEAYVSSDCADGGGYGMCSDGCMGGSCGMFGECGDGCGSGSGWFLDGWSAQGATFNPDNPDDGFNTPVTFNDEANQFQLNQLYLSAGKRTNKCMGWDIGGQVDVLFGSDYFFTQSRGLETRGDFSPHWNGGDGPRAQGAAIYGLALPQLYMEVFAPVGNGINVKIGHFYTILGYESVRAPDNFFYSHAYTMQYGEPFTHTGVLAETSLHPQVLLQGGFTRGWDNWEDNNDDLSFLGGLSLSNACGTSSLAFSIHTGKEDDLGLNNRTVYSVVYSKQIYQRLRYVFQHDFGVEEDAVLDSRFQPKSAKWYGANNYLIMDVNDSLSLATRVEWFRDQDNYRVTPGLPVADGSNFYGITTGANYRFSPKAVLRPELRWDWSDVEGTGFNGVYNTFSAKDQFTFGIDLILSL